MASAEEKSKQVLGFYQSFCPGLQTYLVGFCDAKMCGHCLCFTLHKSQGIIIKNYKTCNKKIELTTFKRCKFHINGQLTDDVLTRKKIKPFELAGSESGGLFAVAGCRCVRFMFHEEHAETQNWNTHQQRITSVALLKSRGLRSWTRQMHISASANDVAQWYQMKKNRQHITEKIENAKSPIL